MIHLQKVGKEYRVGTEHVHALKEIDLTIGEGEFVAIVGPSGSGKSTLLHLIGGLDTPTDGTVRVNKKNLQTLNDKALSRFRNKEIGFIFQEFHLQSNLSIVENVEMPLMFSDAKSKKEAVMQKKARGLLTVVGLEERLNHKPNEISGGQKQRVAIARALINNPRILLADEPTGNLDSITGKNIIHLLKDLHRKKNLTIVIVTHDREIAKAAERIIEIKDGLLIEKNSFEKFTS